MSARVLSTTNEEEQGKRENPIKLITDGGNQEDQNGSILEKADATGENVNGEDALDVDDIDAKLTKPAHVTKASQNMVGVNIIAF